MTNLFIFLNPLYAIIRAYALISFDARFQPMR